MDVFIAGVRNFILVFIILVNLLSQDIPVAIYVFISFYELTTRITFARVGDHGNRLSSFFNFFCDEGAFGDYIINGINFIHI